MNRRVLCGRIEVESMDFDWGHGNENRKSSKEDFPYFPEPVRLPGREEPGMRVPDECTPLNRPFGSPIISSLAVWPVKLIGTHLLEDSRPSALAVVRPNHGNLHSLRALTNAVFFDIIGPPYDDDDRVCSYFERVTINPEGMLTNGGSDEQQRPTTQWVRKLDADLDCQLLAYDGPQLDLSFLPKH